MSEGLGTPYFLFFGNSNFIAPKLSIPTFSSNSIFSFLLTHNGLYSHPSSPISPPLILISPSQFTAQSSLCFPLFSRQNIMTSRLRGTSKKISMEVLNMKSNNRKSHFCEFEVLSEELIVCSICGSQPKMGVAL